MNKKRVIALLLAIFLLIGVTSTLASSTAGGADDPLISLSYLTATYKQYILQTAQQYIDSALSALMGGPDGDLLYASTTGSFSLSSVGSGGGVSLEPGCSLLLISGKACFESVTGDVINITTGALVSPGEQLVLYHRYMALDGALATVTISYYASVAFDGAPPVTPGCIFKDVNLPDWFFEDVQSAVELKLISGKTDDTYEPSSSLTYAEAVKLAACMNQLYHNGGVTLDNGTPWYQPYIDYALERNIISKAPDNPNAPITRADFVAVFYNAMPASEYKKINTIADNAIPDVGMSDTCAEQIYAFYRAGILTGSDDFGTFNPKSSIVRSEVAAILSRMYDESARQSVELG